LTIFVGLDEVQVRMRLSIMPRLCCPLCAHDLDAKAFDGNDKEIVTGILLCEGCTTWFPIANRVPVLLDFETKFHQSFADHNASKVTLFSRFKKPNGKPRKGEISVQATFSDEWNKVQHSDLSFRFDPDELVSLHRDVWLRWLGYEPEKPQTLLNVGCGLGRETSALMAAIGNDAIEAFAIDLNFALLQSGEVYKHRHNMHPMIASLFALPFKEESFDLVYSQGVLHHTYSTQAAFRAIAKFAKPDGKCFIWVYGLDDHLAGRGLPGLIRRILWPVEHVVRPILSRSPGPIRDAALAAATTLTHPVLLALAPSIRRKKGNWKWMNTNHSLRDLLTPRYAYRHTFDEVVGWFEEEGFRIIDVQSASAYRKLFNQAHFGIGMTGEKAGR
jgi:SAM-dependent methyltransferase/uncharacterized protein YbaR (Trm112 family)